VNRHLTANFSLAPQQSFSVAVPADGATWRMEATKLDDGTLTATALENCGGLTPGLITAFWLDKGPLESDFDCRQVIGSYDPNLKSAVPAGAGLNYTITANRPVQYTIDFQNTGTDTAFTVVIRDTLSPWLDPAGIRPGAAGHPYNWSLSGQGILTVTFPNILLPDSNVNEAASHGFVQFTIDQKRDNKPGTRIENSADIYFDFNAPIRTNTVFHTVEKDFLPTATHRPANLPVLNIWPNPAAERLTVQLDRLFLPGQRLILYDTQGRIMHDFPVTGSTPEIRRNGLPAGMYWLELRDKSKVVAVGKAVFGVLGH